MQKLILSDITTFGVLYEVTPLKCKELFELSELFKVVGFFGGGGGETPWKN